MIAPPVTGPSRIAPNAKRPDPRKDALGPEAGFAKKRAESRAAASRSTSLVKSKALIAGELYDANGAPIAAVIDATSNNRAGDTSPGTALIRRTEGSAPSQFARALRSIPTWGWLAIAGVVAAGAYVTFSGESLEILDDDDEIGPDALDEDLEAA